MGRTFANPIIAAELWKAAGGSGRDWRFWGKECVSGEPVGCRLEIASVFCRTCCKTPPSDFAASAASLSSWSCRPEAKVRLKVLVWSHMQCA